MMNVEFLHLIIIPPIFALGVCSFVNLCCMQAYILHFQLVKGSFHWRDCHLNVLAEFGTFVASFVILLAIFY